MDFVHIIFLFPLKTFQAVLMYNDSLDAKIGKTDITLAALGWTLESFWERNVKKPLNCKESFVSVYEDIKTNELMIKFILKTNDALKHTTVSKLLYSYPCIPLITWLLTCGHSFKMCKWSKWTILYIKIRKKMI